jgi:NADPH-dependent curcumin reductase
MTLLNPFARVAMCGLIADYNSTKGQMPTSAITQPVIFITQRIKMQGFVITDHLDLWSEGMTALEGHVASGRIKYRETIADGLTAAPKAFIGMLKGQNFGKQLVRLASMRELP